LFALPTSPPTSFDSELSYPYVLTALGAAIVPHMVAHLQPQLQSVHAQALSSIRHHREQAALEFEDNVDEMRAELRDIADQGVEDLVREAGYSLDKVRAEGEDTAIEVGDELDRKLTSRGEEAVRATLTRLMSLKKCGLEEVVRQEVARQEAKREFATQQFVVKFDRRGVAESMRSARRRGKGGYRGLGERWRKVPPAT
jgi:hypothetical protein